MLFLAETAADVFRAQLVRQLGDAIIHSNVTVTNLCSVSLHTCKEPVAAGQAQNTLPLLLLCFDTAGAGAVTGDAHSQRNCSIGIRRIVMGGFIQCRDKQTGGKQVLLP
jgi:hypothetical protein